MQSGLQGNNYQKIPNETTQDLDKNARNDPGDENMRAH